jgi:ribulose-phosphate 3-epimerase
MIKIAPSILSANFAKLGEEISAISSSGADYIHIDVMDGNFVPNITIGNDVIKSIRPFSTLPFDVHLMINNPDLHIKNFADSGADIITIHAEASTHLDRSLSLIKSLNKKIVNINNSILIELESPVFCDLLKLNSFEVNDFYKVCIKKIIVQKEIYDFNKFVPDEIKEIINNLPISVLKEFDEFLSNQPRLTATIKLLDGSEKEVNGLLDFFIFR